MTPEIREIQVAAAEAGERLDALLARAFSDLSRSAVQRLIERGEVTVDGQVVRASFRPSAGQRVQVRIPPPVETRLVPSAMDLTIVYEDADLLVVDKPAGLVVHPAPGHPDDTLANALRARYPDLQIGGELRPGIVHRLDKDTSGLLVVAKNDRAMASLVEQMGRRAVLKEYVALVHGAPRVADGGDRRADRPAPERPEADGHRRRRARGADPLPGPRALPRATRSSRRDSRPAEPTRSASTSPRSATRSSATPSTGAGDETLGISRQFLHARRLGFAPPLDGRERAPSSRRSPRTWWTCWRR